MGTGGPEDVSEAEFLGVETFGVGNGGADAGCVAEAFGVGNGGAEAGCVGNDGAEAACFAWNCCSCCSHAFASNTFEKERLFRIRRHVKLCGGRARAQFQKI